MPSYHAYRERDLEAWRKWNSSRSDADLDALLKQMDGVIFKEVNRWGGVLSRPVLETEAKRIAKQAFEDFDPQRGVALSTYLTNALQKLSRITYKHQNITYRPEHSVLKIGAFDHANRDLSDRYGREASTEELADYLSWSPGEVTKFQKQQRPEFLASGALPGGMFTSASNDGLVDFLYHDLSPMQKIIFEHSTGYGGKPVLSNTDLQRKLNMTPGTFSYEKRKIVEKLQKAV